MHGYRRKTKHGRRRKNGKRATARRLCNYEKAYITAGNGLLSSGVSGSCRLLYDGHRRSAYEPTTNLPPGQLALQGISSSGTMFIDPDPLCPSHGHLCRSQERSHHSARHHPSTHSLLFPHDRWDCADNVDPTKGARLEPRCPGCDAPLTAADVCHCDCTRPDVADVERPSTLPSPPQSSGSAARSPTPVAMLQTDDLKLQKTRRKSVAGTNSTSSSSVSRKQSAATPLRPTDDANSSAEARQHAGEIEPLLVTGAVLDDDEEEERAGDGDDDDDGEVTSPLRVIGNGPCRNVEQRIDNGGDATRMVA